MKQPLSPRLKQALDFITSYIREKGYPPTYREISAHPSNAYRLLDELVSRGYIRRDLGARGRRNITMLGDDAGAVNWEAIATKALEENKTMRHFLKNNGVPLPPGIVS